MRSAPLPASLASETPQGVYMLVVVKSAGATLDLSSDDPGVHHYGTIGEAQAFFWRNTAQVEGAKWVFVKEPGRGWVRWQVLGGVIQETSELSVPSSGLDGALETHKKKHAERHRNGVRSVLRR